MIRMVGLTLLACGIILLLWVWTTPKQPATAPIIIEAKSGAE